MHSSRKATWMVAAAALAAWGAGRAGSDRFALGVTLTWDANGATAGVADGPGSWNTTAGNTVWWDGATNVIWAQNSDAVFGGTSGTPGIVTVTGAAVTPNSLTFNVDGYTIADTSTSVKLTLTSPGGVNVLGNATFSTMRAALMQTVTQTWNVAPSKTLFIDCTPRAADNYLVGGNTQDGDTLTIAGGGTVVISQANTTFGMGVTLNSKLVVNSGTLVVSGRTSDGASLVIRSRSDFAGPAGVATVSTGGNLNLGTNTLVVQQNTVAMTGTPTGPSGELHLDGGVLHAGALGNGTIACNGVIYFNGGGLRATMSNASFVPAPMLVNVAPGQGPQAMYVSANGATVNSNGFDIGTHAPFIADPSSAGGGFTKSGAGTLTTAVTNTYSGATTVSDGTYRFNGLHTTGGAYAVASGATLAGTGTIGSAVNVSSGGHLAPGGSVGTLTVGDLSLDTSILDFELDASGADRVNAGALTPAGVSTFNLTDIGGAVAGTYTLIDYTGSALADLSNFTLANGGDFGTWHGELQNNTGNTSVDLVVSAVVSGATWTGNTDNTWSTAGNWSGGVPNAIDASATFASISSGQFNVNVDGGNKTVGTINFDNATSYTLGGAGPITMDVSGGNASINVVNGSHTISAPLALSDNATVTVTNASDQLTVSGLQDSTVAITKAGAGNLVINSTRAAGLSVSAGTVAIASGGGSASSLALLSVSPGATLDLNDNDLVTGTAKATVETLVRDARNAGAWNQPGITSTAARNLATTGLGVLSGTEYDSVGGTGTFSGQTYAAGDTLVKYTWNGDANLDGRVTFDDYVKIDTGFNQQYTGWLNGDFNYSGTVNFDDYVLIDIAFNQQSGTLQRAIDWVSGDDRSGSGRVATGVGIVIEHFEQFGTSYGAAFLAAVPEPSALLALGVPALSSIVCPRRRPRRRGR
jgi:fibronectin-binding autotransporter adhesin